MFQTLCFGDIATTCIRHTSSYDIIMPSIYMVYVKYISDICHVNDFSLSFGRLSCTDPGPRRPPAAGQARADPPQRPAQTPLPPCQIRVSVMDMSRLKKNYCRSAAAHRAGPSAGPPPDGARLRGIRRRAGRRAGLLRPRRCARDGVARSAAARQAGLSAGPPPDGTLWRGVRRRAARRAGYKWTVYDLVATINLIKSTDFIL
jgi:hypothetical protein